MKDVAPQASHEELQRRIQLSTPISDNEAEVLKWLMIKNMVLIVTTAFSVYFISPWMFFMLLCYTTYSRKDGEEKQL